MADEAMMELIRQAEAQASKLENGSGPTAAGTCQSHGELARGVSLSLRLLLVTANASVDAKKKSGLAMGASMGIPTPLCLLVWFVGKAKGWW